MDRKNSLHSVTRFLAPVVFVLALCVTAAASSKEQVLYSFQGIPDGAYPVGGVTFDSAGNLYGATTDGGSSSCNSDAQCGTVYQLTYQNGSWSETVLYVFRGNTQGGDGATPAGGVILDAANNLYGTTGYGGSGHCVLLGDDEGCGTVYEMSPPTIPGAKWTYRILYSFKGGKDGYLPMGNLVFDAQGNLYGATYYGGGYGTCNQNIYPYCGTIFELSPPKNKGGKWREKVLYSFKSGTDGANPNGSLVFDKKGNIYGTTALGGNQNCHQDSGAGCGTAFMLSPPKKKAGHWGYEVLHRFHNSSGDSDGRWPGAGVIVGAAGALYGTTLTGGATGNGTVFSLSPPRRQGKPWKETIIRSLGERGKPNDGASPVGLTLGRRGRLYSLATSDGVYGGGTIFELKPPAKRGGAWGYAVLYSFMGPPDGDWPMGYPVLDKRGNLYGVTQFGGTGTECGYARCGTVFEFTPNTAFRNRALE